jgi:hypothetical protein
MALPHVDCATAMISAASASISAGYTPIVYYADSQAIYASMLPCVIIGLYDSYESNTWTDEGEVTCDVISLYDKSLSEDLETCYALNEIAHADRVFNLVRAIRNLPYDAGNFVNFKIRLNNDVMPEGIETLDQRILHGTFTISFGLQES